MIYEIRTYNCAPGKANEVIDIIGEAYPVRAKYSEVAGFWSTDIGPLHQLVHIWPYQSTAERLRIREAAASDPGWPPDTRDCIVDTRSEIYRPVSFCPELTAGQLGPVYEMRTYSVKYGRMDELMERWQTVLEARLELSPLLLALVSEHGPLNQLVHIWPYQSLEHRADTRAKAEAMGIWPPKGGRELSLRQENKILLRVPFSPLQ